MSTLRNLRHQPSTYIVLFALALTCALAACSTGTAQGQSVNSGKNANTPTPPTASAQATPNSTSTTTSGSAQTPTTPAQEYGTANGCPSNVVVNGEPAAKIILQPKNAASPITAHVGDLIEIQLPFGEKWSGPLNSQGNLALISPFGYARAANHACIWRFSAKGTGTTQLSFYAQMLCKPGYMCAQYVLITTFTINVQ
ncbi:MAG TPA: hypothetical protein VKR06_44760 [Ktedonosporobacter sp.]|nr:hypothetical protein [Ktedonosporobacter sp.]